jgi:hypothetical protein
MDRGCDGSKWEGAGGGDMERRQEGIVDEMVLELRSG